MSETPLTPPDLQALIDYLMSPDPIFGDGTYTIPVLWPAAAPEIFQLFWMEIAAIRP